MIIDKLALAVRRSHARAPVREAGRAAHALETYIQQNSVAFAARPDLFDPLMARKLTNDSQLAFATWVRSCSSAARPVSFAAVTAICTCATSFSSKASRRSSTLSSFPTKSRVGTSSTIWLFF